MTLNELDKLRKSVGISRRKLADFLGYDQNQLESWEKGCPIPEKAVEFIGSIQENLRFFQENTIQVLKNSPHATSDQVLICYNNKDDFHFSDPELYQKLTDIKTHKILIKRIMRSCKNECINIKILLFNKKKYNDWLKINGLTHSPENRAKWVSSSTNYSISCDQYESMENSLNNSIKSLNELKKDIPLEKDIQNWSKSILIKINCFRLALLHNIIDLAQEALADYKKNKLTKSAIITRALFERQVVLYSLCDLVSKSVQNSSAIDNDKLNKLMGSKGEFAIVEATNILTLMDRQNKHQFSDSKMPELYAALSNLTHPNFEGVFAAYADFDFSQSKIIFGLHDKGNIGLTLLTALSTASSLAFLWNKKLIELLSQKEIFTLQENLS
ncbi:MAG: hypothetical protein HKM04_10995 [Legionellales bacterium]|nr:hypothetical protein [Legionellales bacterium]